MIYKIEILLRSKNNVPTIFPLSISVAHLFTRWRSAVWHEWPFLKPDCLNICFIEEFLKLITDMFLKYFWYTRQNRYRTIIINRAFLINRDHHIRHTIRICGVNMVNDRRSIMYNTRWFYDRICCRKWTSSNCNMY